MARQLKPRGPVSRDTFGYYGARAKDGCEFAFTVSGTGTFPEDMLRFDSAIVLSPVEAEGHERREVRIVHAGGCTPERWRSFGWSVHDDIVEVQA
jgi:hypothetical protein